MSPLSSLFLLNEKGEVVPEPDVAKWAKWFEHSSKQRQVALTEVETSIQAGSQPVLILTLFTGFNHNPFSTPPALWESMIFGGTYDKMAVRYTSKEKALEGHKGLVKQVQEKEVENDAGARIVYGS